MIDSCPQYTQFSPHRAGGATALFGIASACNRRHISDAVPLEEVRECQHRKGDALRRDDFWSTMLLVVLQRLGYEDLSGITWAVAAASLLEPLREEHFSLCAVCRASAALAAAAVF